MRFASQVSQKNLLVIISPHFDDAIFSVGGKLSQIARPVKTITICGGMPSDPTALSSWDKRCGFLSGIEASTKRKIEDSKACQKIKADSTHLFFTDFPYSGTKSSSMISKELEKNISDAQEIWAPLGIGNHADHIASRNAALELASKKSIPIALYADAPYASAQGWNTPDPQREKAFQWEHHLKDVNDKGFILSVPKIEILDQNIMLKKLTLIFCFESQLPSLRKHYLNITEITGELSIEILWSCTKKN